MHILRNDQTSWSLLFIGIHWLSALAVFGLYWLGWYMVELDYYDAWYRSAPFWHKSIGLSLVVLIAFRLILRGMSGVPKPLSSHASWEHIMAGLVHALLYLLLVAVFVSGYLISTADGRGISFFGWFEIPALISEIDNLEDLAGEVHEMSTDLLIVLSLFHVLGTLKHHVVDRDDTLRRMLGCSKKNERKKESL